MASWTEVVSKVTTEGLEEEGQTSYTPSRNTIVRETRVGAPEPGDILVALADGLTELRAELAREREARRVLEERVSSLQTELARERAFSRFR
jgi:hypothetical protein